MEDDGVAVEDDGRLLGVLTYSLTDVANEKAVSMFLDVATILRGQPKKQALAVWSAWHGKAAPTYFEDLSRRCLLEVDAHGRLKMHDVLVALGRRVILKKQIATDAKLKTHFGSRVWVADGKVVGVEQVGHAPINAMQIIV